MNDLGKNVLGIMEDSNLGVMSIHVLKKQSGDAGIDLNSLNSRDIQTLMDKLKIVLPFFIGDEASQVLTKIKRLGDNGKQIGVV
ncbi:MAG: hypothetical protein KAS67_03285 [Thermoplasmata archaeon]|nr:hypothetical protein [Thermoplasmata archaeon]